MAETPNRANRAGGDLGGVLGSGNEGTSVLGSGVLENSVLPHKWFAIA